MSVPDVGPCTSRGLGIFPLIRPIPTYRNSAANRVPHSCAVDACLAGQISGCSPGPPAGVSGRVVLRRLAARVGRRASCRLSRMRAARVGLRSGSPVDVAAPSKRLFLRRAEHRRSQRSPSGSDRRSGRAAHNAPRSRTLVAPATRRSQRDSLPCSFGAAAARTAVRLALLIRETLRTNFRTGGRAACWSIVWIM